MDSEYDRKFEEMKKYIPFLESMITRLENTSTGSGNPRQAQLDKIRSLRDLLLDKKKRMKMDNLLKCEQVLINLYAKVEQRDTLPGIQPASEIIPTKDKVDLNLARNKLKTITTKTHDPDTLPEIARASETEVVCTPGSKEPALFQRRPNISSLSPVKNSSMEKSPQKSNSKRNYTRVLVSPDRSERLWSPSDGPPSDQHLYSRRSPPRTSHRYSPSYHKRERKKSSRQESHTPRKSKDLNITLKVPEESLNSLNTKDIVSRIINCSDGDVDIATLRELRTQILGELKQTGANEDISDLILKSYKNKKNKKSQSKNKNDIEEGELSDSESEAIENIYGNLVVVEKDKSKGASSNQSKSTEQDQVSRKIQICLVINSDKEEASTESNKSKNDTVHPKICDTTDFELFDDSNGDKNSKSESSTNNKEAVEKEPVSLKTNEVSPAKTSISNSKDIITIEDVDTENDEIVSKSYGNKFIDMNNFDLQDNSTNAILSEVTETGPEPEHVPFKVNFYKPICTDATENAETQTNEESHSKTVDQPVTINKSIDKPSDGKALHDKSEVDVQRVSKDKSSESKEDNGQTSTKCKEDIVTSKTPISSESMTNNGDAEIPLLNEPTVQTAKKDIVSEIDILQALKNEILSDTISIPCTEVATPALHQPKVTKVSNAQDLPKKRISIENYKRKSAPSSKPSLFVKNPGITLSKKESMKQSLKLTEKEVERFNLMSKIALSDSSDEDTGLKSPDDVVDLAPKSPDVDIADNTIVSPPVIIPVDPVKMLAVNSISDVDMRKLPILSPNTMGPSAPSLPVRSKIDMNSEITKPEVKRPTLPVDPRVRKEPLLVTPLVAYPNMTPSRNPNVPNMTPSRTPNMTPNARSFEVTPSRPFDTDDNTRKHVYTPMFSVQENPVERNSVWESSERSPVDTHNWDMSNSEAEKSRKWEDRNTKSKFSQRDDGPRSRYNDSNYDMGYNRSRNDRNIRDEYNRQQDGPNYYARSECPATPTPSFGRGDPPSTPSHYFGRSECPRTPSHPFGRSESSNHSFGMSEGPPTPSHPFGRSEAPMTPSHPFGRSEAPTTPSHPFGRSEAPMTPSHPFGRSDYSYTNPSPKYGKPHDPRLNRSYDHDSNTRRDAGSYNDRNRYNRNDPRNFSREHSVTRNDPKPYTPDQTYNREQSTSRREPSIGRSIPQENDREPFYSRDRKRGPDNSRSYAEVGLRRTFQREPSASRSVPDHRARASSVGRNVTRDTGNELSVESHAGRAFTIDTSVNSTFQKFLDSHRSSDSFDARRQRASSVGRSLTHEASVGRTLPLSSSHKMEDNNRDRFRRAQSVGRDLSTTSREQKSFKDVKAEFETYRNRDLKLNKDLTRPTRTKESTNLRDPRIRRDSCDKTQDRSNSWNKKHVSEQNLSANKFNYRDPRQRREHKFKERSNYQHNRNRSDPHDRHSYGISSDTVLKNPIISSVKNYKIPKIKRAPEEKPVEPVVEVAPIVEAKKSSKKLDVKNVNPKSKTLNTKVDKKMKQKKAVADKISTEKDDNADKKDLTRKFQKSEKRITRRSGRINEESRSSMQSEEDDEIIHTRTRKSKKVIYDSDSDETSSKKTSKNPSKIGSPKKTSVAKNINEDIESDKKKRNQEEKTEKFVHENSNKNVGSEDNQETLDTSFGLDDLELFSDNIITDPVLDNINALIADLDNDLATPKGGATCNDLLDEISIENMLEKITTSPAKPETKKSVVGSPKANAETVKMDLFDTLITVSELNQIELDKSVPVADDKKAETSNKTCDITYIEKQTDIVNDPQSKLISQTDDKNDPEPVVSTSVIGEESSKKDQSVDSEKSRDGRSTPDSTNDAEIAITNVAQTLAEKPDSTIQKQCEMNSDISSTLDTPDKPNKENLEISKETASVNTIGSCLLSILQDKSKIKELLSMLGDQSSENEKIKKKLEKLSEIVSDDDDTNENQIEKESSKSEQDGKQELPSQTPEGDSFLKQNESEPDKSTENESSNHLIDGKPEVTVKNQENMVPSEKSDVLKINQPQNDNMDKTATSEEITHSTEINRELIQRDESDDIHNHADSKPEDYKATENDIKVTEDDKKATEDDKKAPKGDEKASEGDKKNSEDQKDSEDDNTADSAKIKKNLAKKIPKRLKFKKGKVGKQGIGVGKRMTRSEAAGLLTKPKPKKASRELKLLQESIKEMFMSDDILNSSGIRMCRLAKMAGDTTSHKEDGPVNDPEPVVVLEKVKHVEQKEVGPRKKPGPKPKMKKGGEEEKPMGKHKPGPKSKTRFSQIEKDPYDFETDSLNESKSSEKVLDNSSDSESESLASSKSFGSTELLVELKKKPKRKRGGWKTGVIKPKNKKRKVEVKRAESPPRQPTPEPERKYTIPDFNCFTDKNYCFSKKVSDYSCRLCESTHSGADIVFHYKKHHPHSEIPLSRMSPEIAREAIEQCGDIDFRAISKMPTEKYTCRFCFKEFAKRRAVLEAFFWHVVSMHTGEYKQLCSECINVTRCPFNLDIPPPPKDVKGQLIGYICGKCNFTQISLENLKTHVIVRHNDKETEVYTINFAVMTKKTISSLVKRCSLKSKPRATRSTRSNQSYTEASDDKSEEESEAETTRPDMAGPDSTRNFSFKSKITFENDDNASDMSNIANTESNIDSSVKVEQEDVDEDDEQQDSNMDEPFNEDSGANEAEIELAQTVDKNQAVSDDITDYPHFKVSYTDAGNKEYVCCINGSDNHYKTGLLISMKKHVQLKHSEIWDGYCFLCKVIVTSQGQHKFSECLMHYLDKHIDNLPVLERITEPVEKPVTPAATPEPERAPTPKSYINVRPLEHLLVKTVEAPLPPVLPVIENVVSLVPPTVEPSRPSPTYPVIRKESEPPKEYKYEEAQAEVMSKKHRVVLDAMMSLNKLVQIFKCAGRFCSFTSDSLEDALLHASTHQRVGGTNALLCTYCDFDSSGNSIDLVSHVFKSHGHCQYVCGLCFYRAAASQLVGAHITRVHGVTPEQGRVLKSTNAPAIGESPEANLTRETAVPLYICKQSESEDPCSFRTVTHNKFWEHLTHKHTNATGFNCSNCSTTCEDATTLVLHLKSHGLKLYHCTLCVFGADSDLELLAHASAKHPGKPPQAYIRTICATSGNGSFKILPLVELKKTALPAEEVPPNNAKENPVREAERSITLEKLIGHMLDTPTETAKEPEKESSTSISEILPDDSNLVDDDVTNLLEESTAAMATLIPVPLMPIAEHTPPRPVTPPPVDLNLSNQRTPVLKEEPVEATPEKNDDEVICLDSDEEDSKQGIINLSDDEKNSEENPPSFSGSIPAKKPDSINVCGKCGMIAKTFQGFRKHSYSCFKPGDKIKCTHCPFIADKVSAYMNHHNVAHSSPTIYKCGVCSHTENSMSLIKKHVRTHNITKLVVTSQHGDNGDLQYVVSGNADTPVKAKPVKRKSSGNAVGTPSKVRRYGPSDVDKLPINPILEESVFCDICEFNTKVRLNMVRHLQLHAEQQPAPQTAPVNPVPHLETNEKHFDKMVNLASSSITTRAPEKPAKEPTPTTMISSDKASRFPQFVPERYRYTCGAKGCTYISVDEGMLRCHWETLHSGTTDYHCVHCPPHQHLDKSRPLTASRILAHLKMHDMRLYSCFTCPYYHYSRKILEKHVDETHRDGRVEVVREECALPPPATPTSAAPTMDLKPWQCGLCKFKSMLRPEVIEHCARMHNSKMQYKCAYCPFRTSTPENVTKHQTTSHPTREHEIFYFYYREGSIPHDIDGIPQWQKQRQKTGVETVKAEADPIPTTGTILPQIQPKPAPVGVNLNLVKKEIDAEAHSVLESLEDLCQKYGDFCEPNGLNYKCSLCKVVMEDSKEAMQCHLFEELQYRKWGCRLCSYKAFHQTGLKEHMWTEHRQNQEPIELPVDVNVEAWVTKQLEYQEDLIKKNREKLAQQKMRDERTVAPSTSKTVEVQSNAASNLSIHELEKYFGSLGVPSNMQFNCPKCQYKTKDESMMQDHLEAELTRIRWWCSNCPNHFSTYHEAQFHCKSVHAGKNARPTEAARDPSLRSAWVAAVIRAQKLSMNCIPVSEPDVNTGNDDENSLLMIRYEENVPTPEEETPRRQISASTATDSDDESLIIDEQAAKKTILTKCPYCDFTSKYSQGLDAHVLRHYNLKPFSCPHCDYNNHRPAMLSHLSTVHPDLPTIIRRTDIPTGPPLNLNLSKQPKKIVPDKKAEETLVCLVCEKLLSELDSRSHVHEKMVPMFAKRGAIVVKCCECLMLFPDVVGLQQHFTATHPELPINYAYYKTDHDSRGFLFCFHCNQRFSYLVDLKTHHNLVHSSLKLKYTSKAFSPSSSIENAGETANKRMSDEATLSPKRSRSGE